MAAVEEVRRAFGFCADHMDMLRRIDVEDMKTRRCRSALCLLDTFAGIVEELEGLIARRRLSRAPVPRVREPTTVPAPKRALSTRRARDQPSVPEQVRGVCRPLFSAFRTRMGRRTDVEDREVMLEVQRRPRAHSFAI